MCRGGRGNRACRRRSTGHMLSRDTVRRCAGWNNTYDSGILGNVRGANSGKIGECRIGLLLGAAPSVYARVELIGKLRRGAEARSITVGGTIGDREPGIQALRYQIGAWGRTGRACHSRCGYGHRGSRLQVLLDRFSRSGMLSSSGMVRTISHRRWALGHSNNTGSPYDRNCHHRGLCSGNRHCHHTGCGLV